MSGTPKVVAAVLLHEAIESLAQVLTQLDSQTVPLASIVVFDNASRRDPREAFRGRRLQPQLLRADHNVGVGAGHAAAWRAALQDPEVTHVWVLEHDTLVEPDCLEQLLGAAEATSAAVYVPRLERSREEDLANARRSDAPEAVLRLTFNGILLTRETIAKVGYPREEFFVGAEDWDFSNRLERQSLLALKVFRALALHPTKGNKRFGVRPNVFRSYYSTRNWMYLDLESKRGLKVGWCWLWCLASVAKIVVSEDRKLARVASRVTATYDALSGRMGPRDYWFLRG